MTTVAHLISEASCQGSLTSDHDEHADWITGPVGRHRDSDLIDETNWDYTIARMREVDPEQDDHEVIRFRHFAVGWIDELATRPGSRCAEIAQEIRGQLDVYPILDEHAHSDRELDRESENWPDIMRDVRSSILTIAPQFDALLDQMGSVGLTDLMIRHHIEGESDGEGWRRFSMHVDIPAICALLAREVRRSRLSRADRRRVRRARKARRGYA